MAKKNETVKMSPPWDGYMNMLASFFRGDDRIRVGCGTDKRVGTVAVFDSKMYAALEQVLKTRVRFGNVVLRINIVPADGLKAFKGEMTDLEALRCVLSKNPAFAKFVSRKTELGNFVYCMFKPVVLMWHNDNPASPYKQTASVYETAALEVFKSAKIGISYATEPVKCCKAACR